MKSSTPEFVYYIGDHNRAARLRSTSPTALQKVKGFPGERIDEVHWESGRARRLFTWIDGKWVKHVQ